MLTQKEHILQKAIGRFQYNYDESQRVDDRLIMWEKCYDRQIGRTGQHC